MTYPPLVPSRRTIDLPQRALEALRAVDPDAFLAVLDGRAASEVGLSTLRGIVDRLLGMSSETSGGDQVDDIATVVLL